MWLWANDSAQPAPDANSKVQVAVDAAGGAGFASSAAAAAGQPPQQQQLALASPREAAASPQDAAALAAAAAEEALALHGNDIEIDRTPWSLGCKYESTQERAERYEREEVHWSVDQDYAIEKYADAQGDLAELLSHAGQKGGSLMFVHFDIEKKREEWLKESLSIQKEPVKAARICEIERRLKEDKSLSLKGDEELHVRPGERAAYVKVCMKRSFEKIQKTMMEQQMQRPLQEKINILKA